MAEETWIDEHGLAQCRLCSIEEGFEPCCAMNGLICTREKGHDGPHAACGFGASPERHPLRTWEDE